MLRKCHEWENEKHFRDQLIDLAIPIKLLYSRFIGLLILKFVTLARFSPKIALHLIKNENNFHEESRKLMTRIQNKRLKV